MIRTIARMKSLPWAIDQASLEAMIDLAERQTIDPEFLAAREGRHLENTHTVTIRDGVAVIPVTGPLFRYANLFTAVSGATSYQDLATDLTTALHRPDVRAILLDIDSPGGEANGCAEFAEMVYQARGRKPIAAYIGGAGQSAAYWIASAADPGRVVANETGMLGSIGAVMSIVDGRDAEEKSGRRRYDIVSTLSPDKRVDVATDDGRGKLQVLVDALADVFVNTVARNRGENRDTVLAEFGRGGSFVGQAAVTAGLADRLGTLEGVLAELAAGKPAPAKSSPRADGGAPMEMMDMPDQKKGVTASGADISAASIAADHPEVATALRAEGETSGKAAGFEAGKAAGVTEGKAAGVAEAATANTAAVATARTEGEAAGTKAENARISGILQHAEATKRPKLAASLAFSSDMSVEAAAKILASAAAEPSSDFAAFRAAMGQVPNPKVGAGNDAAADARPSDGSIAAAKALGLAK